MTLDIFGNFAGGGWNSAGSGKSLWLQSNRFYCISVSVSRLSWNVGG